MRKEKQARISVLSSAVPVLVLLLVVFTAGCAATTPVVAPATPVVSPYIKVAVEDVKIRYLATKPVQVELLIRGALPDQCKYEFYSLENRGDQDVKITLYGIHPAGLNCPQTKQTIEYALPLGRDLPEAERGFVPGSYQLRVNDYQTTLSIR
jgi:hypothetical protein